MDLWLGALTMILTATASFTQTAARPIALEVLEPAERTQPVRAFPVAVGLVFPEGELRSPPAGRVVDDQGRSVPFEAQVTGWWSADRKSVRWLLLRFQADTDRQYSFEPGAKGESAKGKPLAVTQGDQIVVSTGPVQVTLPVSNPELFGRVVLNGKPMVQTPKASFTLVADDGQAQTPGKLTDWKAAIEEATPLRASVKAGGIYRDPAGEPLARLDVRYEFFKDESFVRVYHTFTWMVADVNVGARQIALRLRPDLGDAGTLHVGQSDYTDAAWSTPWRRDQGLYVHQADVDSFQVTSGAGGKTLHEGEQLGGLISLESADGRGVSVALRHPWQMFPNAVAVEDGELAVEFWPRQGPRMSYAFDAIMPPDFYNAPNWKNFWWSKDAGHYTHEYARRRNAKGEISDFPYFKHTAEGVARTHELTFFFHDASSTRTAAEINSITQHPVILRQDPAAAMRVPFMGFNVEPLDTQRYPDLERAIELLGRMVTTRYASSHEYGFWRFGMVWWGNRQNLNSLYRWSDGVQYDQQLLPWMLFMRGGGREFYENGEVLARFAMDACTNHYNTRGFPTGYMGTAGGGMSFPFIHFGPWNMKGQKIHFLAHYYHLTGYPRAKEVMDEVIAGTTEATLGFSDKPEGRVSSGREIFNMNVFWANAWDETFDPQVKELARECLELSINREYDPEKNTFRNPPIYRFNGFILQDRLWNDPRLKQIMLRYLDEHVLSAASNGGVRDVEATIACDWAYRESGDDRYARIGWDVARQMADVLPETDLSGPTAPHYVVNGNSIYRQFLGPILFNTSLAARLGYTTNDPFLVRDAPLQPNFDAKGPVQHELFVRSRRQGDLVLRVLSVGMNLPNPDPIAAIATTADGKELGRWDLEQTPAEMTLPGLDKGATYRLHLESGPRMTLMVLGDADIVHGVTPGQTFAVGCTAGQYYSGNRMYTRTSEEQVTFQIASPQWCGYTIRDAQTGELLYRSVSGDKSPAKLNLGKDRLICITGPGYSSWDRRSITGVVPYFATTAEGWFDPTK